MRLRNASLHSQILQRVFMSVRIDLGEPGWRRSKIDSAYFPPSGTTRMFLSSTPSSRMFATIGSLSFIVTQVK